MDTMNVPAESSANDSVSEEDILSCVEAIDRIDNHSHAGLSYDQLTGLIREQQQMLQRLQPYGRAPTIGTATRPRLRNLRTPMQEHPNQRAYDLTRSAAQQSFFDVHGSSSSATPMGRRRRRSPQLRHRPAYQGVGTHYKSSQATKIQRQT